MGDSLQTNQTKDFYMKERKLKIYSIWHSYKTNLLPSVFLEGLSHIYFRELEKLNMIKVGKPSTVMENSKRLQEMSRPHNHTGVIFLDPAPG